MAERFRVTKTDDGQWYWLFIAENGETIARSSESYVGRNDCLHSIRIIKEKSPQALVFDISENLIETIEDLP